MRDHRRGNSYSLHLEKFNRIATTACRDEFSEPWRKTADLFSRRRRFIQGKARYAETLSRRTQGEDCA